MEQSPQAPKPTSIASHAQWRDRQDAGSPSEPLPSRLPAEFLERVIRRAAQLQNRDETQPGQLTAEEIVRIAEEVGISAPHVRRAFAETHAEVLAEALAPETDPENRLVVALFGSGHVAVRRVMAGGANVIQQRIEALLREHAGLAPLRQRPLRSLWERARGRSSAQKKKRSERDVMLAKCRSVDLRVDELESEWTLVILTADITNHRRDAINEQIWWPPLAAFFGANILGSWFGIAASSAGGWLLGLAAFGVFAGVAAHSVMQKISDRRQRVTVALDDLLDRAA